MYIRSKFRDCLCHFLIKKKGKGSWKKLANGRNKQAQPKRSLSLYWHVLPLESWIGIDGVLMLGRAMMTTGHDAFRKLVSVKKTRSWRGDGFGNVCDRVVSWSQASERDEWICSWLIALVDEPWGSSRFATRTGAVGQWYEWNHQQCTTSSSFFFF